MINNITSISVIPTIWVFDLCCFNDFPVSLMYETLQFLHESLYTPMDVF